MKRHIITILVLILYPCFVNGQDTITTYFDHHWKKCSKASAVYYRKAYPAPDYSGMWIVEDYHMNGLLQMKGKYMNKKFKKQHGVFTYYHYNGKISSTGQYLNNEKVGMWKSYYKTGSIAIERKAINNKPDSISTYYHMNGAVLGKANFVKGKLEGESKWYYESGNISEICIYQQGKIQSKINYDDSGNIIERVEKDSPPEFPGGNDKLIAFIQQNLEYPKELIHTRKSETILVHFTVRKDGSVGDIEFIKSEEPLFNKEVIKVFDLITYMNPRRFHGQAVDAEMTIPISFKPNPPDTYQYIVL